MRRDQCSFTSAWHVLLRGGSVCEVISCLIKHSHSDQLLHAVFHFVAVRVCIRIQTYWKHSYLNSMLSIFSRIHIRHLHSHYAQVEFQF